MDISSRSPRKVWEDARASIASFNRSPEFSQSVMTTPYDVIGAFLFVCLLLASRLYNAFASMFMCLFILAKCSPDF